MDILAKILARKKQEVAAAKSRAPLASVRSAVADLPPPLPFAEPLLAADGVNRFPLIAEIKRRSPSKGVLCADFSPARIAAEYAGAGAACLSVLTDAEFFGGDAGHIAEASAASALPVLRKDFVVDEWQIWQSRLLGASAVLLIVAALSARQLRDFAALARELNLDVLVEAHSADEMEVALTAPAPALIGVNNRDLKTFQVDVQTTVDLLPAAAGRAVVSESGIHHRADVVRLQGAGVAAFLIGESIINNPAQQIPVLFTPA